MNVVTNITIESGNNPLSETDHAFRIVDNGMIPEANGDVAGKGLFGQNVVYLNGKIMDNKPATKGEFAGTGKSETGEATLERTGSHEVGHSAGASHSTEDKNLMVPTDQLNAGLNVTQKQMRQMIEDFDNEWTNRGRQK